MVILVMGSVNDIKSKEEVVLAIFHKHLTLNPEKKVAVWDWIDLVVAAPASFKETVVNSQHKFWPSPVTLWPQEETLSKFMCSGMVYKQ